MSEVAAQNLKPIKLICTAIIPNTVDESKSPILYIHTVGSSKDLWPHKELQEIANKTKRESFVLDARCHGDSGKTAEFSLNLIVEDLKLFLESGNYKRAVLVGHGFGGVSACLFALKHSNMVEMLVNIEGTLNEKVFMETSKAASKYLAAWARHVRSASGDLTMEQLIAHVYELVYKELSPEGLEEKEKFYKFKHPIVKKENGSYEVMHSVETIITYLDKCGKGEEKLNLEGTYAGPTLFMMAKNSEADKSLDAAIKEKFPNLVIKSLENTTHHIHLLFPKLFVDTFIDFHDNPPKA